MAGRCKATKRHSATEIVSGAEWPQTTEPQTMVTIITRWVSVRVLTNNTGQTPHPTTSTRMKTIAPMETKWAKTTGTMAMEGAVEEGSEITIDEDKMAKTDIWAVGKTAVIKEFTTTMESKYLFLKFCCSAHSIFHI